MEVGDEVEAFNTIETSQQMDMSEDSAVLDATGSEKWPRRGPYRCGGCGMMPKKTACVCAKTDAPMGGTAPTSMQGGLPPTPMHGGHPYGLVPDAAASFPGHLAMAFCAPKTAAALEPPAHPPRSRSVQPSASTNTSGWGTAPLFRSERCPGDRSWE
ncbi:hypothetical protein CYMTET_9868 [Cymbomonas tetramitiformis]|uniref:Uncharacterized protein n=1 Tax=Cymbomonas tetramitiformis TaxID=36881 RepID=A0AAE0LEE8_9CHLO|nr:hypothetical protein CYMTET_9868 [Cymbomonas tetramitiformis]